MMYGSWDMEPKGHNFLSFWAIFYLCTLPLPLTTNKINILKKMKTKPRDVIILQMFTINKSHMMYVMYGSWDMGHNRQNVFVILNHFLPFYPTSNPKNQNFEKMNKTPGDIIILHQSTKNHDHKLYCSWDIMRDRWNFYFSFLAIFCLFRPLTTQKIKIKK